MFVAMFKAVVVMGLVAGMLNGGEALALTIPTGHVITSDGDVVHVTESENTAKQVEIHGHAIVAGQVVVAGEDGELHSITVEEAKALLRSGAVEGLTPEVQEALADLDDDALAAINHAIQEGELTVDELQKGVEAFGAECINAANTCGITEEQLQDAGINPNG